MNDFFVDQDVADMCDIAVHDVRYARTLDPDHPRFLRAVMIDGRYRFHAIDICQWLQRPSQRRNREALLAAFVPQDLRDQISQLRRKPPLPMPETFEQMVDALLPKPQTQTGDAP